MKIYLTLVLFLFSVDAYSKSEVRNYFLKENTFSIKEDLNGFKVEINIAFEKSEKKNFSVTLAGEEGWGVSSTDKELRFIKNIKIKINNRVSFLRLSSFADIFNLSKLSIDAKNKNEILVKLGGGDASTSYDAVLTFDNEGYLNKRRVEHGEFPNVAFEETKYSYNRGEL